MRLVHEDKSLCIYTYKCEAYLALNIHIIPLAVLLLLRPNYVFTLNLNASFIMMNISETLYPSYLVYTCKSEWV